MSENSFRRKFRSPISLFSFQDIIIGVTGILIIFMLIMVLSSKNIQAKSADSIDTQLERLEAIQKLIESHLEALTNLNEEMQLMGGALSAEQLKELMKQLEGELAKFQAAIASETASIQEEIDKKKQQIEQVKEQTVVDRVELEKMKAELKELSRQTLFLPGEDSATDILILDVSGEHCEWFWRKNPNSKTQFPVGNVEELKRLLRTLDKSKHQIVIFCRPSGILHFRKYQFLVDKLRFRMGTDALTETAIIRFED